MISGTSSFLQFGSDAGLGAVNIKRGNLVPILKKLKRIYLLANGGAIGFLHHHDKQIARVDDGASKDTSYAGFR